MPLQTLGHFSMRPSPGSWLQHELCAGWRERESTETYSILSIHQKIQHLYHSSLHALSHRPPVTVPQTFPTCALLSVLYSSEALATDILTCPHLNQLAIGYNKSGMHFHQEELDSLWLDSISIGFLWHFYDSPHSPYWIHSVFTLSEHWGLAESCALMKSVMAYRIGSQG